MHDALCVAYLIDPSVVRLEEVSLRCDTVGFHTYGRTIIDRRDLDGFSPNAFVAFDTDTTKFNEILASTVGIAR